MNFDVGDTVYWLDESRGYVRCFDGLIVAFGRDRVTVQVEYCDVKCFEFPPVSSLLATRDEQEEAFDRRIRELRALGR